MLSDLCGLLLETYSTGKPKKFCTNPELFLFFLFFVFFFLGGGGCFRLPSCFDTYALASDVFALVHFSETFK